MSETPTSIQARTTALETVYERHQEEVTERDQTTNDTDADRTVNPPDSSETDSVGESGLSDSDLLEKARNAANGEKFSRLWQGTTTGYDSHSEADMALCALLAFWSGGDRAQIDRLFSKSGLMRPKWDDQHFTDGSTYGEKTIDRVVRSTTEYYEPSSSTDPQTGQSDQSAPEPQLSDDRDGSQNSDLRAGSDVQSNQDRKDRTQKHLEVISDLQAQVERLEEKNQQLRERLAALEESTNTEESDSSSRESYVRRLLPW